MTSKIRFRIAGGVVLLVVLGFQPVRAQENMPVDLTGTWRWIAHENWHERVMGPDPGRYWGLPLNDAARMRADTYAEGWVWQSSILQCRPRSPTYQPHGLDPMRIDKVIDPVTRQLVAYSVSHEKTPGARMIWLDGRPRLSEFAHHSWEGFSTGAFTGDMLEITTTHLKESYLNRAGVPSSPQATVIEQVFLEEPYLHWVFTVIDPNYLTEPLVRSGTYIRAPTLELPPYPCQPVSDEFTAGDAPHNLPGEHTYSYRGRHQVQRPAGSYSRRCRNDLSRLARRGARAIGTRGAIYAAACLRGRVDARSGARGRVGTISAGLRSGPCAPRTRSPSQPFE